MNKLFTKIAALALGATMAVGVGVAVSSAGKETTPVSAASTTWSLVTSAKSDWSGEYIAVSNGKYFKGSVASGSLDSANNYATATISNNTLTADTDDSITLELVSGSTYKMSSTKNGYFIGRSNNSNGIDSSTTYSANYANTITFTDSSDSFEIAGKGGRKFNYNTSSGKFRYFASGTVQLFAKSTAKLATPTGLSASGSTLTWNRVTNNSGYAYSINTNPATTGNIATNTETFDASTLSLAAGDYTFQVKAKGDGTNYSDSDFCTAVQFTISGGGGSSLKIIFNDNGSDSSTALTTANFLGQVTSGSDLISACTNATKVYPGDGGIKFGSSSAIGSFTISFAQGLSLNGAGLSANLAGYGTDGGNFIFSSDGLTNDITIEKGSTSYHDAAIGTFTSEPTYLTVSTSVKRGHLSSLSFETSTDPVVTISTDSTTLTYDGSGTQEVTFTASPLNFEGSSIEYEWYSTDDAVLDSTDAGDTETGTFTIAGSGSCDVYVYALSDEDEEATSSTISMTVNNEQYSGSLAITTNGNMLTGSTGTLAYTLTGNTHPMDSIVATSSNPSVISFDGLSYTAGSTVGGTATVTLTASSTTYSLETYTATLAVTLLDAKGVVSIALSNVSRTAKFGGQSNSVYVTATLADSTTATDKPVSWEVDNPSIVSVTENVIDNKVCGTLVPVNVGTTKIRAKLKTDNTIVSGDCTVTVQAPDTKEYSALEIVEGSGVKKTYYADDTTVDTTGLSLKAIYTNDDYPTYREEVAVAADASGVTWTLDTTNRLVKASYTISAVTQENSFSITITERPIAFIPYDLGLPNETDLTGPYDVSELSLTFAKGEGSNSPKYYTSGTNARMYVGNTLTITSSAQVASIDSIEITFSGNYSNFNVSVNQGGEYSRNGNIITFTGTTEITFTVTTGGLRFTEMVFAYTKVQPQDKDVTDVTVTPSTITLPSGDDTTLTVSVLPVDARDISVTWSVINASPAGCVTVESDGTVHAIAEGSARVVATSNDQPTISDYCDVTVTKGPIVKYIASASVTDTYAKMGNAYFEINYPAADTYYGYETDRGAQFGSGSHNAGTITFQTIDLAFATNNLKVVVNASHSGDGQDLDLHVNLGNTQIGDATSLTKTATDYEFEYSGSGSSTVDLSNKITISMTNNKGALFIKTIKIYADYYGSQLDTFCSESLRMDSYDVGGTQGSTGGNGSCKVWWDDVISDYDDLTAGQKYIFNNDDAYSSAKLRLSEWARINGYSYNSDGTLSENEKINPIAIIGSKSDANVIAIVVITSVVSLTAIGGYFFLRKRREQN